MGTIAALAVALSAVATSWGPHWTQSAAPNAAELARGHWSTNPKAPIDGRSGAASAWTGTEMLIWGGTGGGVRGTDSGTGAAYDPARRAWTMLPRSPLDARTQLASVWTGHALFIWGGDTARGRTTDGALYDPDAKSWKALPAGPTAPYVQATALWTGNEVILLTSSAQNAELVHATAFDPKHNRWTTLADLTLPAGHPVFSFDSVSADERLYVWSRWTRTVEHANSTTGYYGIDTFTLNTTADTWTKVDLGQQTSDPPIWTGHDIVLPEIASWCGACKGGPHHHSSVVAAG